MVTDVPTPRASESAGRASPPAGPPTPAAPAGTAASPPPSAPSRPPREQRRDYRRWRELDELRGVNVGGAFFGWLVSVGIAVILGALLAAGGAAIGLEQGTVASVSGSSAQLTATGAALLLAVLVLSYATGGYVAGRLSRFNGALQGVSVWLVGGVTTVVLALTGAIAGAQYNVLGELRLPSLPVQGQTLVGGAAALLIVILVLTMISAALGGIVGHHYHIRVDRALASPRDRS